MSNTLSYTLFGDVVEAFTTRRILGRDRIGLCQMLCIDDDHLIIPHQTHQDVVRIVDEPLVALPDQQKKDILEGVDAVVTNVPRTCIGVSTADCIPVLLYDPEHCAVGAAHAGWRGTVKRIVQKTIDVMQTAYGTRPEKLMAVIGPGISVDNFEVGDEVYDAFADAGFPMDAIAKRYPTKQDPQKEKWHLDIVECNKLQLIGSGLPPGNIHVEAICTFDNTDQFFSARKEQKGTVKCGRNFNAIMIK